MAGYSALPNIGAGFAQGLQIGNAMENADWQRQRRERQLKLDSESDQKADYDNILQAAYLGRPEITQDLEADFGAKWGDKTRFSKMMPSYLVNDDNRRVVGNMVDQLAEGSPNREAVAELFTQMRQDEVDKIIGQPSRFGGVVNAGTFKDAIINEDETVSFMYDWTGTDADGNEVSWEAPISENRISDPDDPARAFKLTDMYADLRHRDKLGNEMAQYRDAWKGLTGYVDPNSGKIPFMGGYIDPKDALQYGLSNIPQVSKPYKVPMVNELGDPIKDGEGNQMYETKYRNENAFSREAALASYDTGFQRFRDDIAQYSDDAYAPENQDVILTLYRRYLRGNLKDVAGIKLPSRGALGGAGGAGGEQMPPPTNGRDADGNPHPKLFKADEGKDGLLAQFWNFLTDVNRKSYEGSLESPSNYVQAPEPDGMTGAAVPINMPPDGGVSAGHKGALPQPDERNVEVAEGAVPWRPIDRQREIPEQPPHGREREAGLLLNMVRQNNPALAGQPVPEGRPPQAVSEAWQGIVQNAQGMAQEGAQGLEQLQQNAALMGVDIKQAINQAQQRSGEGQAAIRRGLQGGAVQPPSEFQNGPPKARSAARQIHQRTVEQLVPEAGKYSSAEEFTAAVIGRARERGAMSDPRFLRLIEHAAVTAFDMAHGTAGQ